MQHSDTQPYILQDQEIQPAIQELFSHETLRAGLRAFLQEPLYSELIQKIDAVDSIAYFQQHLIYPILLHIQAHSITHRTTSGLQELDPQKKYLFISNHKDIILDSAYLNAALFEHGFETSQIAIGDNLMKHRIAELIFRINKSFVVKRTGSPIELYRYSVELSKYIYEQVREKKGSVWLAQREGRSKDGNDRTQTGLLKMLSLSNAGDLKTFFKELNIVPVSISYEYDPCGLLKAQEYLQKQADPTYKKTFQEDLQHIMLGLAGEKGSVHFHFGTPLTDALDVFDSEPNAKKQLELLATLIDDAIHEHYRLHPVNYVAYDLLRETSEQSSNYSTDDYEACKAFLEAECAQLKGEEAGIGRAYLLGMYANPLINHLAATNKATVQA